MKAILLLMGMMICLGLMLSFSCTRGSGNSNLPAGGPVIGYAPVPVTKTVNKKVFAHLMPWFETKASNGSWGIHWKMNTKNPDITGTDGRREIAAHYYPLIGPYASGDTVVIAYQLLLMKLSGIDGVFIDWPGTQPINDYPLLVKNTEKIVSLLDRVGLSYAIVYEDQNLVHAADKITAAKTDITYLQNNHFRQNNYEKISGKPMLLDFGPQVLQDPSEWAGVFSVLDLLPAFFTLWFESGEAGAQAAGEFAWIPQNHLSTLNSFYNNNYAGRKMAAAYPGFDSFYGEGGWNGPVWSIPHNGTGTFIQTLDLALAQAGINYIQLATWNDYGEGTMIEPTREFGYDFLTTLQQKLGVTGIGKVELEMVARLYQLRRDMPGKGEAQNQLNQVFYYLASLQFTKASDLLNAL